MENAKGRKMCMRSFNRSQCDEERISKEQGRRGFKSQFWDEVEKERTFDKDEKSEREYADGLRGDRLSCPLINRNQSPMTQNENPARPEGR